MKIQKSQSSLYNLLFKSIKDCVVVYEAINHGENFRFVDLNPAAENSESVKKEDIQGKLVTDVFPGVEDFGIFKVFQEVYKEGKHIHFPLTFYVDERISGWRDNYVYKLDEKHIVAVYNDITKEKQDEAELKLAATVFDSSLEGILITDKYGTIVKANDAFIKMSGYSENEILGQKAGILKSHIHSESFYKEMRKSIVKNGFWEGEIWDRKKNGESFAVYLYISTICDSEGHAKQYLGMYLDITENKRTQEQIQHLAYFDTLTTLPNRAQFDIELLKQIKISERKKQHFSLLMLDLDNFKYVNDAYGHQTGDLLLVEVAKKIKSVLRQSEFFARLGGDEFVIISDVQKHIDELAILSQRIIELFAKPTEIGDYKLQIGCSIGVANYPIDGDSKDILFKNADSAMYEAKKNGRNRYIFYSSGLFQSSRRRLEIDIHLRQAIENENFEIFLQPKVCINSAKPIGAEALIRWNDEHLGFVSPVEFIPHAEETGLMVAIGDIVLKQSFQIIKALEKKNYDFKVSINISSVQLQENNFIQKIEAFLEEYQCSPSMLEFEITESKIMHNIEENIIKLQKIKNIGIQISIDDFGTGYSSMSYLKRLPVDMIKIDKSFIDEVPKDSEDCAIVQGILSLAKALSLKTIAEGVELKAQEDFLRANGCDYIQGYLHSKPLNKEDFFVFIDSFSI